MYHNWGYSSIYWPSSYPFISLAFHSYFFILEAYDVLEVKSTCVIFKCPNLEHKYRDVTLLVIVYYFQYGLETDFYICWIRISSETYWKIMFSILLKKFSTKLEFFLYYDSINNYSNSNMNNIECTSRDLNCQNYLFSRLYQSWKDCLCMLKYFQLFQILWLLDFLLGTLSTLQGILLCTSEYVPKGL